MPRCNLLRSVSRWLALPLLLVHCAAAAGTSTDKKELLPLLLSSSVNGKEAEEAQLFLRDAQGRVLVSEAFLRQSKIRAPGAADVEFDGEKFFLLDASLPIAAKISEQDQSIDLTAPAELFEKQVTSLSPYEPMEMSAPGKGLFVNYDFLLERSNGNTGANGAIELGVFHPMGVGSTRFVGNLSSGRRKLTRLDTNWVIDRPGTMTSLRIGDGISGGTASAPPVRFAGIQYSTNFATQPGFVTMPLRSLSGSAALPSVIDVYVNNVLQGTREVAPGPFDISGVPLQSGGGNIQLVVRDLLGRQVVSDQQYYSSAQMLGRGLSDFSYEIGFLRRSFGTRSNDYGALIGSARRRHGISDAVTAEGIVQASRSTQVAGAGLSAILGNVGLASGSVNFSNSRLGKGQSVSFSLERRIDGPSFGARAELATRNFGTLGTLEREGRMKSDAQLFVDLPLLSGTLGLNYIHRRYHADPGGKRNPDESLAGIFTSVNLGRAGSLQLFARRSSVGPGKTVLGGYLAMPLGARRSAGASFEYRRGQRLTTASIQQDTPLGQGLGYRASVSAGAFQRAESAISINTGPASLSFETSRAKGSSGMRLSAAGAVGLVGSDLFASRRLGDSFGAVKLKGLKNVRVYADNQLIGTTNKSGTLIIPSMRAFERNTIRLDEADLPLDVQVEKTELAVRPFARAGTLVRFAARRERGAVLKVALEDGSALPAGALLFVGGGKEGYVSVSGGEVYVPNLLGRSRVKAAWGGRSCSFEVEVPDNDDPQPRIGGLVCKAELTLANR